MRTILVPTDFSECSADAVKYAIHFAEKTGRKLLFFHSTFLLIPTRSSNTAHLNAVKSDKQTKLKMLTGFIEKIYRSLNIKRDENNTRFLVKFGNSVVENISEVIDEQFIDLIIIGTHGATGFRKVFVGSNTANVIEESYCPVLAIPHKYKFNGIKTIAYASSDLDNLKKELKKIIPVAKKLETSLEVFHITAGAESLIEKHEKFNSEVFMKSLSRLFKFHNMSLYVINGGKNILIDAIGNFVKHNKPDILTMLTHKRGFFEKIFNTSQTKEISYKLSVPLMVLK
ncbi:MAG: universal stress protein [Bacteroidetes bacterium]|nr:universal stress protein [Bacteroidota bacterium]